MRNSGHRVDKRCYAGQAPVIARTNHQIVALRAGVEYPPVPGIHVGGRVVSTSETGHDSDVPRYVLIEFSEKAVVVLFLFGESYDVAIEGGTAILVERTGVVTGALVSISTNKFVTRIVLVLGKYGWGANHSHQEQEKSSGHPKGLLVGSRAGN